MEAEVRERDKMEGKIQWNPILQWAGAELDPDKEDELFVFCNGFCPHFLQNQIAGSVWWGPRDGSWQRMHITQPSSTQVTIARDDMKRGHGSSSHILDNADGVHLEQLSRIVSEVLTPGWGNKSNEHHALDPNNRRLRVVVRKEL